jgi:hypothetical protein
MVVLNGSKKEINIYVVYLKDTYMSRPKPTVLKEFIDKKTYKSEQVLQAEAIWAVFFQNAPFNLKSANILTNYPGPKYKKTSFSNPGHAHNLAKKLNDLFDSDEFTVVKLTAGETVVE